MSAGHRVTFYTRPGCHLCDDARAVVAEVCAELGESFVEVSIEGDLGLERQYGHEVPVTLVDGRRHDYWRVDAARLRSALVGERQVSPVNVANLTLMAEISPVNVSDRRSTGET